MRKLLLFFAMLFVSVGTWAAITISSTSVSVGGTTYQGYGIYGAKAGEIAQLLSGDNSVSVKWNGATLNDLKSAEYIKVGDSQNPNVLKDEDLVALQLLSGAKFLDIDGSVLDEGADITKIKAGSAIEAVTLPNNLKKEKVNGAGASLTACNPNFGSCLSLDAEMEEREISIYPYKFDGQDYEYTGDVSALTDNGNGTYTYNVTSYERDLTLVDGYPLYTYTNDLAYSTQYTVSGDKVSNGKAVLSEFAVPFRHWDNKYENPFTHELVDVSPDDPRIFDGPNNNKFIMVDFYPNTREFNIDTNAGKTFYKYQYVNLGGETEYTDELTSPDADMLITVPCNVPVTITPVTQTITAPVEGGKSTAIAYVNTPGSLYKATSLDINDVKEVDALVISGNINNGDISQGGNSGNSDDPQYTKGDTDKYESNGAISAFNFNNTPAPIKSVDMSDAVIDDYKHLRVLNAYGANLESVVFPKTVTRIPNYCCYSLGNNGCQNLSNVVFPTESEFQIGDYAFRHTQIKSLLIPGTVTQVGDHAFEDCDQLKDVEMEGLKKDCHFGNYVFANCDALKHVTLSEKVKNIGDYQFNQCGLLESIRIPSTCTTIGSYAFYECFSIHQITIPEGVELIKINAFELAGLTDIYLMASTPSKLPKIYAMSPTGEGAEGTSTFTYQRTTGNNTSPQNHRDKMGPNSTVHYDEAISWYQEEQSGAEGLGTGNCLTAIHYPESMKPFFEAFDVSQFYSSTELAGVTDQYGRKAWFTPEEYLALLPEGERRNYVQLELQNKKMLAEGGTTSPAYDFGNVAYQYLPQTYAVDAFPTGHDNDPVIGPDADGRYYPNQHDYWIRMVAGATGTEPGGVNQGDLAMPFASAWGWRQFPLAASIESIGEIPYEKEYDDTWYTMCFPWKMEDNQLFMAFNQKCEIVEFKGAEMVQQDDENYNLVFHFDDVAATYYMDDAGIEYSRVKDGNRVDAAGHQLYIYTSKEDEPVVVQAPDPLPDKNTTDVAVKEQYGKYLSIKNIMVLPGHPYMIHPSIGAAPGKPAKVYINGVKKVEVGAGKAFADYEALAKSQEVNKKVAEISKTGEAVAEEWKTPSGVAGGSYTFIGNINDAVETVDETTGEVTSSDYGKKDMPLPCYFLGVKDVNNNPYPKYYRRTTGGQKKWSQYSAIIVPDEAAYNNIEKFMSSSSTSTSTGAKEMGDVVFGEWEVVDAEQMATVIDNAVAEGKEKNEPAKIQHLNVVYNIKGQVVRSNSTSVEGLPKGLYIVNGKKYMVK